MWCYEKIIVLEFPPKYQQKGNIYRAKHIYLLYSYAYLLHIQNVLAMMTSIICQSNDIPDSNNLIAEQVLKTQRMEKYRLFRVGQKGFHFKINIKVIALERNSCSNTCYV